MALLLSLDYQETLFLFNPFSRYFWMSWRFRPVEASTNPTVNAWGELGWVGFPKTFMIPLGLGTNLAFIPSVSSVQSLSRILLFATPWTAACQASSSITNSQSLLRLLSMELVMPSNHLILCRPLLLLPPIFPNIRVFSNESVPHTGGQNIWASALATTLTMNI